MINSRLSIFKSLKNMFRELTRHGNLNPEGFKDVLYAVILNDMKEWSEYVPTDDNKKIVLILNDYILEHKDFQIERFVDNPDLYRNVNTPQDNTTWKRIWDNKNSKYLDLDKHLITWGTKTFRINGKTETITVFHQGDYDATEETLNLELHDNTLFEQ